MTPKRRILVIVAAAVLATAIVGVWIAQRMKRIMDDITLTAEIPTHITTLFYHNPADEYPYVPQEPMWQKKYLLLDGNDTDLSYNKQRNEALGTHQYFPHADINGLVLVKQETEILGYYKKNENKPDVAGDEAYRVYYAITYFDLKQNCIVARDTVWGPEPKARKRRGEDQHGSGILPLDHLPSEKELLAIIQHTIK